MSEVLKKEAWTFESLSKYIADLVSKESGNILGKEQSAMVESRLKKRLLDLGGLDATSYYSYLISNYSRELEKLVSLLTTHHTFFFREFIQFEYLINNLASIVSNVKKRGEYEIRVLSAACSKGHEVYSLSMILNHHLKQYPGMRFKIIGVDIDEESVSIAKNGVYHYKEIKSIPQVYLTGNWQRGSGDISNFVKVKKHVKENCSFSTLNLLKMDSFIKENKFDIVFCRNVFIYLGKSDISSIVMNFEKCLHQDGILFTGLSESLNLLEDLNVNSIGPSIYNFSPNVKLSVVTETVPQSIEKQLGYPKPIRMLVVDDSPVVVNLLSKIFNDDDSFEFVGSASNGVEANEFLRNNDVDAMTLDIHMPEMDGVTYLKQHFSSKHPNVVVVTSASREDTRYAQEALNSGAMDLVEKPVISRLQESSDEIKNKIKMSFINKNFEVLPVDKSFQKTFEFKSTDQKVRMLFGTYSDIEKISSSVLELKGEQPPVCIFIEGNEQFLELFQEKMSDVNNVNLFQSGGQLVSNNVYICDYRKHFSEINAKTKGYRRSCNIFGLISKGLESVIFEFSNDQILLEEVQGINGKYEEVISDIFPWTSFSHVGTEYLTTEDEDAN